jgi:hypothetical protein
MRTDRVLALFVHSPWVKVPAVTTAANNKGTKVDLDNNDYYKNELLRYELIDWDQDVAMLEGLSIAHVRGRRARDDVPQNISAPQPIVTRPHWRTTLMEQVELRRTQDSLQ